MISMNNYTYEELKTALGNTFKLAPVGEGEMQARVLTAVGYDIAYIFLEDGGSIEASLFAKWHFAGATASEEFPDDKALSDARQEIAEELQPDWEIEGFTVEEEGSVSWFPCTNASDQKEPAYEVFANKAVPTLEDAVQAIQWISRAETVTWL